jgi:hypothetical protein
MKKTVSPRTLPILSAIGLAIATLGVAADRKLTHLRRLCRLKTDPGVLP